MGQDDKATRWHNQMRLLLGARPVEVLEPIAGTPQLTQALAKQYRLSIVTTRSAEEVNIFLDQNGFNGAFSVIVSGDSSRRLRPHPQPVRQAAEALGIPAAQCVLVGDTGADIQAAKAAGVFAIGVLCGFGDAKDLCDADLVLPTTAQLADWL